MILRSLPLDRHHLRRLTPVHPSVFALRTLVRLHFLTARTILVCHLCRADNLNRETIPGRVQTHYGAR